MSASNRHRNRARSWSCASRRAGALCAPYSGLVLARDVVRARSDNLPTGALFFRQSAKPSRGDAVRSCSTAFFLVNQRVPVRTNTLQDIESMAASAMDAASQSFQPHVLGRTAQRREVGSAQ